MGDLMHTDRKIIICSKCEGSGEYSYRKLDSEILYETCNKCNGSGRILEIKKWSHMEEAYNPQKNVSKNLRRKLSDEKK